MQAYPDPKIADMTRDYPASIVASQCPRCAQACETVRKAGYRVSGGSWHDDDRCCAFSIEDHGPATYGHPKCTVIVRAGQRCTCSLPILTLGDGGHCSRRHGEWSASWTSARAAAPSLAAPDLLAACEAAEEQIDGLIHALDDNEPWSPSTKMSLQVVFGTRLVAMRAAIAKARGEAR